MAENAPLTTAHAHARKAAEETRQIHWNEAADEHQAAANDYSRAFKGTTDSEHQRLARIIRTQDTIDDDADVPEAVPPVDNSTPGPKVPAASKVEKPVSPPANSPTSALAAVRLGRPARDTSPSLAREIASRRGIPQQGRNPPSAAAQARARQLSPESHRRARNSVTPRIPPSVVASQAALPRRGKSAKKAEDDEGFASFYNNLISGTTSKLSSALAFAGLPLTADDIQQDSQGSRKAEGSTVRAGHEPDVKKIFSKAALQAIEDEHRQRGTLGHGFGPAESFYVVPPTGMTTSYRDMATGKRGALGEDDEDDFVDAQEVHMPGPPSPRHSRTGQQARGSFGKARTGEELELENTTLKHTLEQLAGRLANFEAHAQDASMAALTQSMVSLRPPPGGAPDPAMLERLRQLESTVEREAEERQKLEVANAEQEKALKKWHARYAKLKEGAREKQRVRNEKSEKAVADEGGNDATSEAA